MSSATLLGEVAQSAARRMMGRPRGRRFASGGAGLYYCDEGAGAPVVLVHGFAVSGDVNFRWPGITRALARDCRVLSIDMRGHGRSDKPHDEAGYGLEMVRDVVRLLDHLEIEKAHVVGYSLGGFVALRLAASHPERLNGVAVTGAGWEQPEESAFVESLQRVSAQLRRGRGVGPVMQSLGDDRETPGLAHQAWVWGLTRFFNDRLALAAMLGSVPALGVSEEELRAIELPVCSIVGSRDPLVRSVRAMEGKLARHSVTFIEDADHIQAPARPELLAALRSFIRSSGSMSG